jgi:hypothetical protein
MATTPKKSQAKTSDQRPDKRRSANWNPNPTGKGGFHENPQNRSNGQKSKSVMESHKRFRNMSVRLLEEEILVKGQSMSVMEVKIRQLLRSENMEGFKWLITRLFGKAEQTMTNMNYDMTRGLSDETIKLAQEKMLGINQEADERPDQ